MKYRITIDVSTDGAAFEDNPATPNGLNSELARVLRHYVSAAANDTATTAPSPADGLVTFRHLVDSNGNACGVAVLRMIEE